MFAKDIVRLKGPDVISVSPDTAVDAAAALFRDQRIGFAIVVNENGAMTGTVSERDIIHGMAVHGSAVGGMTVQKVMTGNIVTCTPDDSVQSVMHQMTKQRTRHVLMMDGDTLSGVVSIGDALKFKLEETEGDADTMRAYIGGKTYN